MHPGVCHTSTPVLTEVSHIQTVLLNQTSAVPSTQALSPEEEVVGFGRAKISEIKVQSVPRVHVRVTIPEKEVCPFKNKAVQKGNRGLKADGKNCILTNEKTPHEQTDAVLTELEERRLSVSIS